MKASSETFKECPCCVGSEKSFRWSQEVVVMCQWSIRCDLVPEEISSFTCKASTSASYSGLMWNEHIKSFSCAINVKLSGAVMRSAVCPSFRLEWRHSEGDFLYVGGISQKQSCHGLGAGLETERTVFGVAVDIIFMCRLVWITTESGKAFESRFALLDGWTLGLRGRLRWIKVCALERFNRRIGEQMFADFFEWLSVAGAFHSPNLDRIGARGTLKVAHLAAFSRVSSPRIEWIFKWNLFDGFFMASPCNIQMALARRSGSTSRTHHFNFPNRYGSAVISKLIGHSE